ncbi:Protein AGENET DOMAIN (AGD)-CONTAINING P1 [Camellia lanceoleosa]|uniref:Protein AGENET DOMAIN (AGD)-CONTAINING P1 n=1 Tax=Camellia lanceoleosa TaxID=1840588 RepID=A0ACC0FY30_9ERIC|nr:Protein AGENET DOMAIN (AGD)-CONTAINING P1 [Camellia lanceoleosa]
MLYQDAKASSSKKKNDQFFVEYQSLLDDDGSTPLREYVKPNFIRPLPPSSESDLVLSFEIYDVVNASYVMDGGLVSSP